MSSKRKNPIEKDGTKSTETSVFEKILILIEQKSDLKINFEDLTGVSLDIPDLRLTEAFRIHKCDYCMLAKSNRQGHQLCIRNKMVANRLALWKKSVFSGMCHMGATDIVRPLVFNGQVLGVFYYGSFLHKEREVEAAQRLLVYCERNRCNPEPFLEELEKLPKLTSNEMEMAKTDLDLVIELAGRMIEMFGLPCKRYRTRRGAQYMVWKSKLPPIVSCVINYINRNFNEPVRVSDIAKEQQCHPDYLSRVFKKSVGMGINEYLHKLRIDHAKRLLESDRFSVGEIGFMVGFYDQSHFGKVFREHCGVSPMQYRQSLLKTKSTSTTLDIDYFEYSNVRAFNPRLRSSGT